MKRLTFGMIAVSSSDTNNLIWAPSFNRSPFYTRDLGINWRRVSLPGETLPFTGSHAALHLQRKTLVFALLTGLSGQAFALSNAFTYQGSLQDAGAHHAGRGRAGGTRQQDGVLGALTEASLVGWR